MQSREPVRASSCNLVPHFKQNRDFSRFLGLLRDHGVFYAWDLCGFVGLFIMPDDCPFRHFATSPQIFIFFINLWQFEQKLVSFLDIFLHLWSTVMKDPPCPYFIMSGGESFRVGAWWVFTKDQSHDMLFAQNVKFFSLANRKKAGPTGPDRIRPDPTGSDRIRPDPTGDLRWDDTIGAWSQ